MGDLLVHIVAAIALLFLVRWIARNVFGLGAKKPGCGGCPSCEPDRADGVRKAQASRGADKSHT